MAKTHMEIPLKDESLPIGSPTSTSNLNQFCSSRIEVISTASLDGSSRQQHLLANTIQSTNKHIRQVSFVQLETSLHHEGAQAQRNEVSNSKHRSSQPMPLFESLARDKEWRLERSRRSWPTSHSKSTRESRRHWLSCISTCTAVKNWSPSFKKSLCSSLASPFACLPRWIHKPDPQIPADYKYKWRKNT